MWTGVPQRIEGPLLWLWRKSDYNFNYNWRLTEDINIDDYLANHIELLCIYLTHTASSSWYSSKIFQNSLELESPFLYCTFCFFIHTKSWLLTGFMKNEDRLRTQSAGGREDGTTTSIEVDWCHCSIHAKSLQLCLNRAAYGHYFRLLSQPMALSLADWGLDHNFLRLERFQTRKFSNLPATRKRLKNQFPSASLRSQLTIICISCDDCQWSRPWAFIDPRFRPANLPLWGNESWESARVWQRRRPERRLKVLIWCIDNVLMSNYMAAETRRLAN